MRRPALVAFARWTLRRRARRQLDGIRVSGLAATRARLAEGPLVLAANHVGWWDGPCMILVDEALGADGRFLVDAPSLARFPFFAWLGAVPLDRSSPSAMRSGLREAAAALDRPGRAVWVFPQGREQPSWVRPLGFGRGHEWLGRHAPIVPVAIAYTFRGAPCPTAFLHLGTPVPAARVEDAVADGLRAIDDHLADGGGGFEPLLEGRVPRADRSLGARLLAGVARG